MKRGFRPQCGHGGGTKEVQGRSSLFPGVDSRRRNLVCVGSGI